MRVQMFFKDVAEIYTEFTGTMIVWTFSGALSAFGYI
jgi:hypothetical protein